MTTSHINPSNHTIVDGDASLRAAEAAEQCEQLIAYLYPALQKVGAEHALARSLALRAMFRQAELTIGLVHGTDQTRARLAHDGLAVLRFCLASQASGGITSQQHRVATSLVAELAERTTAVGGTARRRRGR